ncbi:ATP-binding domain-containing protein [Bordetella genomosp. 9]|uniref:DNA 3'-5' helicase II n=1 Tax=Bordetella genomosp. 9 TaxID=1416803 RepID=A0A1W6YWA9_9BORD|nr:nuclease-related domain-containing DEAD/DEAH box helicase [Bordetella genomosp. 9]ARP85360.1 nuclease [Bordetella genomosp. 9]
MAHIIPDGWESQQRSGPAQRELETLARLKAGLPDDYTVYHAVHWTNVEGRHAIYGEIDFVIVNRAGELLVIEQKSGALDETPEGLAKRHGGKTQLIPVQMARTAENLRAKLARTLDGAEVRLDYLLYCPDHRVVAPTTAGLSPERIVDAGRRDRLCAVIREILPAGDPAPAAVRVDRFLRDIIRLEIDVSALIGQARTMVTRLAGGLAHWARQLDIEPYRLRVTGTAGSGKTQLALAEYRDAIEQGKRPLYVCFNRPLADHFNRIAPAGGLACSFHMLCDRLVRAAGGAPDFSQPDAFGRLVDQAESLPVSPDFLFDTVIVDEGQDFDARWRDMVLRLAKPDARVLWLEDPMQNLYGNTPPDLPGWVRLRAQSNFRSPRPVVGFLQTILPDDVRIDAQAPVTDADVELISYHDEESLARAVKLGIRKCYSAGFRQEDVAVLSYHGHKSSQVLAKDRLGPHLLRRFTGEYDLFGQPVYSSGDVLAESVYRFKGQSVPAVVFAEIDFQELDERAIRKLFVGATRATLKLVLVAAEPAAAVLREKLGVGLAQDDGALT